MLSQGESRNAAGPQASRIQLHFCLLVQSGFLWMHRIMALAVLQADSFNTAEILEFSLMYKVQKSEGRVSWPHVGHYILQQLLPNPQWYLGI